MRVALRTVFGVTPRARNRFLGWRLARGVTPKNARRHPKKCEASPQRLRGVTPTPARSHPENGGMAPHQFFENNFFSEANQLRVLTVHEGHMGHYHHWRTDDSSSSCLGAIVNVGKMRGVTPTDATIEINVLWVFIPLFQHFYEWELVINKPQELICSAKCEIILRY